MPEDSASGICRAAKLKSIYRVCSQKALSSAVGSMWEAQLWKLCRASKSHCCTPCVSRTQLALLKSPLDWIYPAAATSHRHCYGKCPLGEKKKWWYSRRSGVFLAISERGIKGTPKLGKTLLTVEAPYDMEINRLQINHYLCFLRMETQTHSLCCSIKSSRPKSNLKGCAL